MDKKDDSFHYESALNLSELIVESAKMIVEDDGTADMPQDEEQESVHTPPTQPFIKQQPQQPPESVHSTASSQYDEYIPPISIKEIFNQQEDELTELLGSIDALSSTPARIEKNVNDGLFDEDDIDEGLVDVVDMRNVSSSGLRRYGSSSGNRSGLSPVKKILALDGGCTLMEKKLTPLVEEEIVVGEKDAADVSIACPSPETNVVKMPQTTSPDDECKVSDNESATNEPSSTTSAFALTPQGPPEPVSSPPIKSPWLSWTSSSANINSPANNNSSSMHQSAEKDLPQSPQPDIIVVNSNVKDTTTAPAATGLVTSQSEEDYMDSDEDGFGEQLSNTIDLAPSESTKALAITFAGGDIAHDVSAGAAEETSDYVPDSIQQLFRDADSLLQNALTMSPLQNTGKQQLVGASSFCEDYIKPNALPSLPSM